jgi:hypothetical protein
MKQLFINDVEVDLYENLAMPITYNIADILTPDKRNTSFSKTIKIPGSKVNDQLFNWIFDVSKEIVNAQSFINFTPEFNPSLSCSAKIFSNNVQYFAGIAQLVDIIVVGESHEYEINLTGSLKDLFLEIEGLNLENLDMSEYNHTYNVTKWKESWATKITKNGVDYVNFSAGVPTGEGYVYPTIDYGFQDGIYGFGSNTAISIEKVFPAIYVREYFTKIFALAGFTWESDFIDSELFRRLIIPYVYKADGVGAAEILKRSFRVRRTTGQSMGPVIAGRWHELNVDFNDKTTAPTYFDNWPAFDFTTPVFPSNPSLLVVSGWTVPKRGFYDLKTIVSGTVTTSVGGSMDVRVVIRVNGVAGNGSGRLAEGAIQSSALATTLNYSDTVEVKNVQLYAGDIVWVMVEFRRNISQFTGNVSATVTGGATFENKPISSLTAINGTFELNTAIPKGISIKDFFLSVLKMFNMYVEPTREDPTVLRIEPFTNFFTNPPTDEWIEDIGTPDSPKERSEKPCAALDSKTFIFKYKKDNDYFNEQYRNKHGKDYGEIQFDAVNDFVKGTKTVELIFSPTPVSSFGTAGSDMVIPRMFKLDSNGNIETYEGNIRILYYAGVKNVPANTWSWGLFNGQNQYAQAGHLDDPFNPTFDLLFSVPQEVYYGTVGQVVYTTNNLFNAYWLQFIREIVDSDSKLVTTWVHLTPKLMYDLDFRTPIHIKGTNYRLNKIIDYDPETASTKVELIRVKSGFTFVPAIEDVITEEDPRNFELIEGGSDEVVALSRTTDIDQIDGGTDAVINLGSANNIDYINGGR